MGNQGSKLAREGGAVEGEEEDIRVGGDSVNEEEEGMDEGGRVDEEERHAERFAQFQEENNFIVDVLEKEIEWVKAKGYSILSVWLGASKYFREAQAKRRLGTSEVSEAECAEARRAVQWWAARPVEYVAQVEYRRHVDTCYLAHRLPPRWRKYSRLVASYVREGFDLVDLALELDRLADTMGDAEGVGRAWEQTFDRWEPERRLLWIAPALRKHYCEREREPPSGPLSPSKQRRRTRPLSFRSLLTAITLHRRNASSPATRPSPPDQDFIRFPSPSPPMAPDMDSVEDINDKIIAAFSKDFRWLDKRRWPPHASWRLVSALVHSQIGFLDGDVDQALSNLEAAIPGYSKDRSDMVTALNAWRHRVATVELMPILEELPDVTTRRRMREVVDDALMRDFDFYWTITQWNHVKGASISRRQSIAALRARIEDFQAWLDECSPADVLRGWVPQLFECLDEDSENGLPTGDSDDGEDVPYKSIFSIFGNEPDLEDLLGDDMSDAGSDDGLNDEQPESGDDNEQSRPDSESADDTSEVEGEGGENWDDEEDMAGNSPDSFGSDPTSARRHSRCSSGSPRPHSTSPSHPHRRPSSRRPQHHHRDPRVRRVDPLRYQNRLEEPRRLPNTPTVSHQPPPPRSHNRKPERARSCSACGRAFRVRRTVTSPSSAGGTARTVEGRVIIRESARHVTTSQPAAMGLAAKESTSQKVAAGNKTATGRVVKPASGKPASSTTRYPTRSRKAPVIMYSG